jgi:hypothetical protein
MKIGSFLSYSLVTGRRANIKIVFFFFTVKITFLQNVLVQLATVLGFRSNYRCLI